ncbi:MAG TPA: presqualene diphosphate synthase HpnD [Rhizomicrobium sp.]|nr:presqualene diphosphate synthase HpnD [Rhizomicrobium sp.]
MTFADTAPEIRAVEQKVSGSSFYSAMRLLPRNERNAMFAIYAFCRAVDDIADDGLGTRKERHEQLAQWREDIEALYRGRDSGQAEFLTDAMRRYGLRKDDFFAVIDGMEMDVAEDMCAPVLDMLDLYCDRVASAVGRLSVKVFGMEDEPGIELAHHLGRALQLTNILRDIDEDASINRLYLPREFLDEAKVAHTDPVEAVENPAVDGACRQVAALAHEHYRQAESVLRDGPRGKVRTPRVMGAVYAALLDKLEARGWLPPRGVVRPSKAQLLFLVLQHGFAR